MAIYVIIAVTMVAFLQVKAAEADAEAKFLAGQGVF
jgi:hypothetical protein